jgi:hypothetical protein
MGQGIADMAGAAGVAAGVVLVIVASMVTAWALLVEVLR